MGDSVSLPTNVVHSDTVSRIQQSQTTDQQAEEKFAKKLKEQSDNDPALMKNISETERARLRKRREDEESRRKREDKRQEHKGPDSEGRGGRVDLKV